MKAFVTGADGFVGRALAKRLASAGQPVTALVPPGHVFDRPGVSCLEGLPEALDDDAVTLLRGHDILFHCDAFLEPEGPAEAFHQVNVRGTRRMLELALAAGVRRLVYLSSQAVLWGSAPKVDLHEDLPYPETHLDPYSASRAEAERLVLAAARAGRIEAVALRPGWTWGPGDLSLLPVLVRRALKGPIPMVGSGELSTPVTYIDHLLDALVAAASAPGCSGRAYFISDDVAVGVRAFMDLQLGAVGVVATYRHIPPMVARAAAAVIEATSPFVGLPLPLLRLATDMAATAITHDTSRAQQDLAFRPRVSLEEGAARLHDWAVRVGGAEAIAAAVRPRPLESE